MGSINISQLPWMESTGRHRHCSIKRVLRKDKSNECRCPPFTMKIRLFRRYSQAGCLPGVRLDAINGQYQDSSNSGD